MADEPELEDESFDLSELEGGGEAKPIFRHDGELNVHAEYGYLVNKVTAAVVADWWRQQQRAG